MGFGVDQGNKGTTGGRVPLDFSGAASLHRGGTGTGTGPLWKPLMAVTRQLEGVEPMRESRAAAGGDGRRLRKSIDTCGCYGNFPSSVTVSVCVLTSRSGQLDGWTGTNNFSYGVMGTNLSFYLHCRC